MTVGVVLREGVDGVAGGGIVKGIWLPDVITSVRSVLILVDLDGWDVRLRMTCTIARNELTSSWTRRFSV